MGRLAQNGVAVLVIFSKLPEITGICDRIMVMRGEHIQSKVGNRLTMVAESNRNRGAAQAPAASNTNPQWYAP
jgi:ABC-type sugar transport system ATPase subunit